ncbi:MAG: hypothetical protein M0R80_04020 [Proteobacteria bacterium]|jgi:hypothetical protein|nr:hypothetical protein [Pseudomonadota bacterium]
MYGSLKAQSTLDMSVIIPECNKYILNEAIASLQKYEAKFEKLRGLKEEKERARNEDDRCDEMAAGYQLMRDVEINLIEMILNKEF